jgi:hypothetical protein
MVTDDARPFRCTKEEIFLLRFYAKLLPMLISPWLSFLAADSPVTSIPKIYGPHFSPPFSVPATNIGNACRCLFRVGGAFVLIAVFLKEFEGFRHRVRLNRFRHVGYLD